MAKGPEAADSAYITFTQIRAFFFFFTLRESDWLASYLFHNLLKSIHMLIAFGKYIVQSNAILCS